MDQFLWVFLYVCVSYFLFGQMRSEFRFKFNQMKLHNLNKHNYALNNNRKYSFNQTDLLWTKAALFRTCLLLLLVNKIVDKWKWF